MPRVVAVGASHNVTQRGNDRQRVFSSNADRQIYVSVLRSRSEGWRLDVLGYCLLPNHDH